MENMKEIWPNILAVGLRKIPGLPTEGGRESYADADTIPEIPSTVREGGSPAKISNYKSCESKYVAETYQIGVLQAVLGTI